MGKKRNSKKRKLRRKSTNSAPSPISLCMIVKNEEKYLEECLASVQGLVGEMVVVDTGSSDGTVEIARKFGARVYHYTWQNDFAAARNFALSQCSLPWILYLDADERLLPKYHQTVLQAVRGKKADAFYLKVFSPVSERMGNVPHEQAYPRLFRKLPGVRFEGKIHEQISPSLIRAGARFAHLDVTILHLGYNLDEDAIQQKIERNLSYLRQQLREEPTNPYVYFQLGQTLILNRQPEEGKKYLQRALDFDRLPTNLTATIWLILANEDYKEKKFEEALEKIAVATEMAPHQRLGYFLQSECLAHLQKYTDALDALEQLELHSQKPFSDISIDKTFERYIIAQRKGSYHFALGQWEEAFYAYSEYFKTSSGWRSELLEKWVYAWREACPRPQIPREFLQYLMENFERFNQPVTAAMLLSGLCQESGQKMYMEQFLRLHVQYAPDDALPYYYLGNLELERGNFEVAENYYQKALERDSEVWEIYYNLVVTYIKKQDFRSALKVLETALEKFPEKRAQNRRLMAGLYTKLGYFEKALEYAVAMQREK